MGTFTGLSAKLARKKASHVQGGKDAGESLEEQWLSHFKAHLIDAQEADPAIVPGSRAVYRSCWTPSKVSSI